MHTNTPKVIKGKAQEASLYRQGHPYHQASLSGMHAMPLPGLRASLLQRLQLSPEKCAELHPFVARQTPQHSSRVVVLATQCSPPPSWVSWSQLHSSLEGYGPCGQETARTFS